MEGKQAKKLLKIAAFLYVASFLIINWNGVSWIFNYKTVSGMIDDFFNPYPSINASALGVYFYPNHSQAPAAYVEGAKMTYTDKQSVLEIPELSILVPIIFANSTNKESLENELGRGVVYYPGSVYPGQVGQIVMLGHSAPIGWPKVKYDWVFTDIDKLSPGDNIFVHLNNKKYIYTVVKKTIIQKGADVPAGNLRSNNNVLTLISCWPPGKDYQRIVVSAELAVN